MRKNIHVIINGKVQGVFFRDFVKKQASKLGVEGTVQNGHNGSLVIHASGKREQLDKLIDLLYQGPPKAKIDDLQVTPLIQQKDFRGVFRIIGAE